MCRLNTVVVFATRALEANFEVNDFSTRVITQRPAGTLGTVSRGDRIGTKNLCRAA